jgi:Type II secretion system (T2SS), protein E, N-terminal domain
MRIGERLLQLRLIRKADLAEALQAQALHGGRIGTCLVQSGAIELDPLATALGAHLAVPAALQAQFEAATPEVLARLPRVFAERYLAVPLTTRPSGTLVIAMVDPKSLGAIDALEKVVGARVQVCVAPELRIRYWLERHYGIERDNRFLRGPELEHERADSAAWSERRRYIPITPAPLPAETSSARLGRIATVKRPAEPEPADELQLEITVDARRRSGAAAAAIAKIDGAADGDVIGEAVADFLAGAAGGGLLLTVRPEMALGWRAAGPIDPHVAHLIAVPLGLPTAFRTACETGTTFRGQPPAAGRAWHDRLCTLLGQPPAREVVVVPVMGAQRPLALIYAHSTGGSVLTGELVGDLEAVGEAISAALARRAAAATRGQ